MWVLEDRVCQLEIEPPKVAVLRKFLELRQQLQTLLSMSSLVLAFGVIALMVRRVSFQPLSPANFYPGSIVLEGFEYTLVLALAYAPVHAAFNTVGIKLRDALTPAPSDASPEALEQWAHRTDELNELFQVRVYDWKNFGPVYPILAPLVLSLLEGLAKP